MNEKGGGRDLGKGPKRAAHSTNGTGAARAPGAFSAHSAYVDADGGRETD